MNKSCQPSRFSQFFSNLLNKLPIKLPSNKLSNQSANAAAPPPLALNRWSRPHRSTITVQAVTAQASIEQINTVQASTVQSSDALLTCIRLLLRLLTQLLLRLLTQLLARLAAACTMFALGSASISYAATDSAAVLPAVHSNDVITQQQQRWQDDIQQQRIETLRQAHDQNQDKNLDQNLDQNQDKNLDQNLDQNQAQVIAATQQPQQTAAPMDDSNPQQTGDTTALANTTVPPSACLNIQRIELGALAELPPRQQTQLRQQAQIISQSLQSAQPLPPSQPQPVNLRRFPKVTPETTANHNHTNHTSKNTANQPNCITLAAANQLSRQLTQAYLDAGYFKISILPTFTDDHTSLWQVHVAKITRIDNETDLPTQRLFGDVIGKPVNMAWLDQAVSNGERMLDGQLLVDIYPVGNDGQDVRLKVSQQGAVTPLSSDLQWRYTPDDSYGHHQITYHATLRNGLGQADLLSLSLQQSLSDNYGYDDDNQQRSASVYASVPSGRWQWSGFVAADSSTRTTALPNSVLQQTGDTWQANLRGDFTLKRNQNSISTAYGQLAHQAVNNELQGSQIAIQSPTLSSGRLGVSHTKLFRLRPKTSQHSASTGAWVVDVSAEKGLGNHNNPASSAGLSDDYLRWLLTGYLSHQHPRVAPSGKTSGYWRMTHELQGQYSNDRLYGISQQSLGSTYTGVRGLDKRSTSAASGITLRNTLSFEPAQTDWQRFGRQRLRWSPYLGVDLGRLRYARPETATSLNADTNHDNSDAISATLGIILTGYSLDYLTPQAVPSSATPQQTLDKRWQFEVNASRANVRDDKQNISDNQDTEVAAKWRWFF